MPAARPAQTASPGSRMRPRPIGLYLTLLIAVILVPALAFSIVLLQRNALAQRDALNTLSEATAASISEAVDREINGMLTTARVLATSSSSRDTDLERFHARARLALRDSGMHMLMLDQNMNQLMNTRVDFSVPLGRTSDPETARQAQERRRAIVSNGFLGQTAQRWVFNVILPPSLTYLTDRYLVMTQDAENLTAALSQQVLRGGWNVSLVDGNSLVLASSYLSSDIGQPFFLGERGSGTWRGQPSEVDEEREYLAISQRSDLTGWRVVLWAPVESVGAPLRRAMLSLLLGGMAVIALATAAGWLLSRQIAKPARRLARDARRLGAGEAVEAVNYPVAEFAEISTAISRAAEDRRAAENEIRFLMREVAHRSKNQLTVVSSIAKQTARNARSFSLFQDTFQKRLHGLARSTDLLIAGGVAGVELLELLKTQIEPFRSGDEKRLSMDGPLFRLGNQAAQTIGMAAHELATNAAKYGAFASDKGRLDVHWTFDEEKLELVWREHVPRIRRRPATQGFGTQVIERMLGGTLQAEITRIMHRDGLEYRFVMPVDRLRASVEPPSVNDDGD